MFSIDRAKIKENITGNKEGGFTLIEILVVILIIGILAAIAVPVFMNQRKVSVDARVLSDVKNIALATETYFHNNPTATTPNATEIRKLSGINSATVTGIYYSMGTPNDWCVTGADPNAKQYTDIVPWVNGPPYVIYSSTKGGIFPPSSGIGAETCNINRTRI